MIRLDGLAALVIGAPSDVYRAAGARLIGASDIADADILLYASPATSGSFSEAIAHGLQPAFAHARAALGFMRARRSGAIVFCAPSGDCAATAAITGGLVTLARSIAYQYGGDGIRANTLLPGPRATAADIGAAALLLASSDSSFMTGACLPVGQDAPTSWPA